MSSTPRKRKPKAASAPPGRPDLEGVVWADQMKERALSFLWSPYMLDNALTLIEGRKSTGKSSISATIAAAVTGGPPLPGGRKAKGRPVFWDAREDDWPSVVLPRLRAAGADLSLCGQLIAKGGDGRERKLRLPTDVSFLEETIQKSGAGLIVIDPYASSADPDLDLRVEQQARAYLEPLADVCNRHRCAALLTRHVVKGKGGDARDAGLGSVAVGNCARTVLRCDDHPHIVGMCVMSVVATNAAHRGQSLMYSVQVERGQPPRIVWAGDCPMTVDEIAEGRGSEAERDEWKDADLLLYGLIGASFVRVTQIQSEAQQAGISWATIRRAKARLSIHAKRVQHNGSGFWEWGPPDGGWPEGLERG